MVTDSQPDETTVGVAALQAERAIRKAEVDLTHLNLAGILGEEGCDAIIVQLEGLERVIADMRQALNRGPESVRLFEAGVRRRDAARATEIGRVAVHAAVTAGE